MTKAGWWVVVVLCVWWGGAASAIASPVEGRLVRVDVWRALAAQHSGWLASGSMKQAATRGAFWRLAPLEVLEQSQQSGPTFRQSLEDFQVPVMIAGLAFTLTTVIGGIYAMNTRRGLFLWGMAGVLTGAMGLSVGLVAMLLFSAMIYVLIPGALSLLVGILCLQKAEAMGRTPFGGARLSSEQRRSAQFAPSRLVSLRF